MGSRDQKTNEIKAKYSRKLQLEKSDSDNILPVGAMAEEVPFGVREALACIHEHVFTRRLTVKWMKEYCGLNGNNFSGKFKHYVGKTPRQYWLYHRIETAKLLLKDEALTGASITDIAYSLGFNSLQAFSLTFKNYTGCSPKDFRNGAAKPE
ncbi:MAG: AraC family transcriptional regulator [Balneolaceae bacterium]